MDQLHDCLGLCSDPEFEIVASPWCHFRADQSGFVGTTDAIEVDGINDTYGAAYSIPSPHLVNEKWSILRSGPRFFVAVRDCDPTCQIGDGRFMRGHAGSAACTESREYLVEAEDSPLSAPRIPSIECSHSHSHSHPSMHKS